MNKETLCKYQGYRLCFLSALVRSTDQPDNNMDMHNSLKVDTNMKQRGRGGSKSHTQKSMCNIEITLTY